MSTANCKFEPLAIEPQIIARFPCTQSQQRFWILEQMSPGNSSANVALRWKLKGKFNAESIEAAFRQAIARHEILRTRFAQQDGLPVQEVVDHCDFKLPVIDLRTVPRDQLKARLAEISAGEASTAFDISRPGLIRGTLLRLSESQAYLLTTVHHLCFDGFSIRVFGREIGEIASALDTGQEPSLPVLPLQYGDFALWQEAFLASSDFKTEKDFWRATLEDAVYFEVPTDHPRMDERSYAGANASERLSLQLSTRIDAFARREGISVFALMSAILSAMLHRRTKSTDIGIGTQIAGRDDTALEDLVGVFINNLVLRFDLRSGLSFRDHLARSNGVIQDALAHQRMPFNMLVEMLNPPRDPARTPLISVNMIVQKAFLEDSRYGQFELLGRPSATPGSLFDLNFMMIGRPDGWRATVEYNPDLFEAATAQSLLLNWTEAIDQFTANPSLSIGALELSTTGTNQSSDRLPIAVVEAWLTSHPGVGSLSIEEAPDGRRVAYVVPDRDHSAPLDRLADDIRTYLGTRIARASVPETISLVMRLPAHLAPRRAVGHSAQPIDAVTANANVDLHAIETEVVQIWSELLGLKNPDRMANFFDLGGNSLLAVRMVAKLRDRLKIQTNTAILYRAPTIESLVPAIAACRSESRVVQPDEDNRIHDINPEAQGIPIISINNFATIHAISKHFEKPRRCVSVRLVDPEVAFDRPAQRFEEIADAYVELVRRAQPEGPYALFGICVHGNLALEIARRLLADGETVINVFVKDVWAPAYSAEVRQNRQIRWRNKVHDLVIRLRKWRRGELSIFDLLRYYPRISKNRIFQTVEAIAGSGFSQQTRLLATTSEGAFIQYLSAARNCYAPEPYSGNMVMFRTTDAPSSKRFDPTLGWNDIITGKLEIRTLPEILIFRDLELGTDVVAQRIESELVCAEAELR